MVHEIAHFPFFSPLMASFPIWFARPQTLYEKARRSRDTESLIFFFFGISDPILTLRTPRNLGSCARRWVALGVCDFRVVVLCREKDELVLRFISLFFLLEISSCTLTAFRRF